MFEALREKYLSSFENKIQTLEGALLEGDKQTLSTLIHQLAGSSGSYGFEKLANQCCAVERMIAEGSDFNDFVVPETKKLLNEMSRLLPSD